MSDLFPTKTRLALLCDVEAGEVWQKGNGESVVTLIEEFGVSDFLYRCTAAIAEQEQAGWVRLVELKYGAKRWELTDAGRAVLDTHGGAS